MRTVYRHIRSLTPVLAFAISIHATAEDSWELSNGPLSPAGQPAWEPQWSPDGKRLSIGLGPDGAQCAAIIEVATGDVTTLTPPNELLHATTWSADGTHLAYATGEMGSTGFVGRMECVSIESGAIEVLTPEPGIYGSPSWSPMQDALVFPRRLAEKFSLWVQSPNPTDPPRRLTDGALMDHGPEWSPDGTRIAFHSDRAGDGVSIWILDVSTGELNRITDAAGDDRYPDWSPDGTQLVFDSDRDPGPGHHLWTVSATGNAPVQITTGDVEDFRASWSPNGQQIAFSSFRTGQLAVWLATSSLR